MVFLIAIILLSSIVDLASLVDVYGIRLSGFQWLFVMYLCLIFLLLNGLSKRELKRFGFFLLAAAYFSLRAMQSKNLMYAMVDIHYIILPVLIALLGYRAIKGIRDEEIAEKAIMLSIITPALIFVFGLWVGLFEYVPGVGPKGIMGPRSIALYAIPVAALGVSVLMYCAADSTGRRRTALFSLILAILSVFTTLSRTSLLAVFVIAATALFMRFSFKRLLIAAAALTVFFTAAFGWKPMAERLMPEDVETVEGAYQSGAYTSGRYILWMSVFGGAMESPLVGLGTGNSKVFVAENLRSSGILPHNEYLRVFYDGGIVGLLLVLFAWISKLKRHLSLWRLSEADGLTKLSQLHAASILGTAGILVAAVFDNLFLYAFATNSLFMLYGMADKLEDMNGGIAEL